MVREEAVAFPSWLEPTIDAVTVSKDRDTPPDVAAQLFALGDKVNPLPLLREYIEHVGLMHQTFRKLIKAKEDAWESSLATARERYKKRYPKVSIVGLAACVLGANGRIFQPSLHVRRAGQVQTVPPYQEFLGYQLLYALCEVVEVICALSPSVKRAPLSSLS